jgi:hypothetical protein
LQFRARKRSSAVPTSIFLLLPVMLAGVSFAQAPTGAMPSPGLPSAPEPQQRGVISGTVLDTNHDVVRGAHLILRAGSETHISDSGSDGQFQFQNLPPGQYKLSATAPEMSTFISQPIPLDANGSVILPPVVLSVIASASVTVTGEKEQLSIEQVQIAENQRVLAVFPNFYTSFDWNAPPMMAKQKFHLAMRSLFDPVSFLSVAGVAGAEQYENIFPALRQRTNRLWKTLWSGICQSRLGRFLWPRCLSSPLPPGSPLFLQGQRQHRLAHPLRYFCGIHCAWR